MRFDKAGLTDNQIKERRNNWINSQLSREKDWSKAKFINQVLKGQRDKLEFNPVELKDLRQQAELDLIEASRRYVNEGLEAQYRGRWFVNKYGDTKFSTYAYSYVEGQIKNLFDSEVDQVKARKSLIRSREQWSGITAGQLVEGERLNFLSESDNKLIKLLKRGYTQKEIARNKTEDGQPIPESLQVKTLNSQQGVSKRKRQIEKRVKSYIETRKLIISEFICRNARIGIYEWINEGIEKKCPFCGKTLEGKVIHSRERDKRKWESLAEKLFRQHKARSLFSTDVIDIQSVKSNKKTWFEKHSGTFDLERENFNYHIYYRSYREVRGLPVDPENKYPPKVTFPLLYTKKKKFDPDKKRSV